MPRHVAFLRAINVGGRNVKMEALKKIFEADGFRNVATFIASGNVLFDSTAKPDKLERKIEALLEKELGYRVDTFIRSVPELAAIVKANPYSDSDGTVTHIGFTAEPLDAAAIVRVEAMTTPEDRFHAAGCDLYWHRIGRSSDSLFSGTVLEKILRRPATLRNLKTIRKLAEGS